MVNTLVLISCNFLFVLFAIRKIIYISHKKNLFDEPSEIRKIHIHKTPNLGGVAIFISLILSGCFLDSYPLPAHINYMIAAALILFGLGLTDDLVGMDPVKKFLTQLGVAILVVLTTNLRLDRGLDSLFGVDHLPYGAGILLSSFFILFMMNAMNLIDGINGLAGCIALLSGIIFSIIFWKMNDKFFFETSIAFCGCLAGFLYFNFSPAKIFMGDTGSLFIGFLLAIFSIRFLEFNVPVGNSANEILFESPVTLVYALLIIPIFDTVRIFMVRVWNKKSFFEADRNHIHHLLISHGLTHMQATGILVFANISVIVISLLLAALTPALSLIIMTGYITGLFGFAHLLWKQKSKQTAVLPDINYPVGKLRAFSVLTPGKLTVQSGGSERKEVSS